MFDILLRGGLTVEDCAPIEKQIAEAYYLLDNGVKLANGHDAETEEDYAIHYREMQADLDKIEKGYFSKFGRFTERCKEWEREKWLTDTSATANPLAAQLKGFEDRQTAAHKKRRAEMKLMRLQDVESTKFEQNDSSARIAHDVVANVAPAVAECIVTNGDK